MTYIQVFTLSIVEGVTEFLPISSTGHLILTSSLLGISQTEFQKTFEIVIQLGAICAVILLYWRKLSRDVNLWKKILTAFLPSGLVGFLLYKIIKNYLLGNPWIIVVSLFIGGLILIIIEKIHINIRQNTKTFTQLSYRQALFIGVFQAFSIIPGTSRSAATIIGGLLVGLNRSQSVEFSFLLAIPTMIAATSLDLFKTRFAFSPTELSFLLLGLLGSFLTAHITVKYFLRFVQSHTLLPFGIYRISIALLFVLLLPYLL